MHKGNVGNMKQQQLFDTSNLKPGENYVSPQDKRKWTIAFNKWCTDQWLKHGSYNGVFCCGYMSICDECESKYKEGCKDCVETIKSLYYKRYGEIPYKNYNFEEILKKVEEA